MHLYRAALAAGSVLAIGVLATGCGPAPSTTEVAQPTVVVSTEATPTLETTATPTPTVTAPKPPPTTKTTVTTKKTVVELRSIPFKKKTVTDSSMPKGETTIRTTGVNGTRKLTYQLTYVNGVQTDKDLLRDQVSKEPRSQVTAVGTKVEQPESSGCDPNYTGCVPIASDVDCSGGSGNGPEYVAGPVRVIGSDIYGLDSDDDGVGCED
ncbi:G5 domain-containing protein [Kribbella sp. NBC_00889]|uniref:G5 domain-containing protein n=1 Tax=Kribbella sp. NBC_00889 TaxID=2975974 RepID=UPI0038647479|nr:G5 domain-containing protein [Kribbella sp. NBC_00889]